MKGGHCLVN
jgi:hypothetical protein